jgi:hypothetical protein
MPFLSKMVSLWKNLFRRRQVEQDLADELQGYVEEMVERKVQMGFAPEAAREAVLLEIGGMERITELVREQRVGSLNLRSAGIMAVVAIVAFVSGIGTTLGVAQWGTPEHLETPLATNPAVADIPRPVLEGRVVDTTTGQPIPNAEVGLQESQPLRRYTYTDNDGRFSFANPPTTYRLEAGKDQWFIGGLEVVAFAPRTRNTTFNLPLPNTVVVTNKSGQPVGGDLKTVGVVHNSGMSKPAEFRTFAYSTSVIELRAKN